MTQQIAPALQGNPSRFQKEDNLQSTKEKRKLHNKTSVYGGPMGIHKKMFPERKVSTDKNTAKTYAGIST